MWIINELGACVKLLIEINFGASFDLRNCNQNDQDYFNSLGNSFDARDLTLNQVTSGYQIFPYWNLHL